MTVFQFQQQPFFRDETATRKALKINYHFELNNYKSVKISLPFPIRYVVYDMWFDTEPNVITTESTSILFTKSSYLKK